MAYVSGLFHIGDIGGAPAYAAKDGTYQTTLNRTANHWLVENPNGMNQRFKTLRLADAWVKKQLGIVDTPEPRRKKEKNRQE